jgi:hypothetical protein
MMQAPQTLNALLALSNEQMGGCDLGLKNLLCAVGLPGSRTVDLRQCLAILDLWTDAVRRYVHDAMRDYPRQAEEYRHHEGFFRFVSMVTLLKHPRGLGIGYEPKAIGNYDFTDASHDFLHGVLTRKLGTCASLPVLFVAIGRRLGWPMHLAIAKGHVLCQWVASDGSRINLEGSNAGGGEMLPDEHYHRWPRPLTKDELAGGKYLRPLAPVEEVALFLETRGHCLMDNGRYEEARQAYAHAHRFAPGWSNYEQHLFSLTIHERLKGRHSSFRCSPNG